MTNSFTFKVEMMDGSTVEVKTAPSDILDMEAHFGKGMPAMFSDMHITYLWWLAWHALDRGGKTAGMPFDVWKTTVADVATASEVDAVPLETGPGTDSPPASS